MIPNVSNFRTRPFDVAVYVYEPEGIHCFMPTRDLWSRDELLVVLDLYSRKGYVPSDP